MKNVTPLKTPGAKAQSNIGLTGEAVVVYGEDAQDFDALLADVSADLKPRDLIEKLWIQDFVYLHWEVLRYRRLKSHYLSLCRREALERILGDYEKESSAGDFEEQAALNTDAWIDGDKVAIKYVEEVLKREGGGDSAVIARGLSMRFEEIERIDRLMMAAEQRRDRMLRDLEGRRADIAVPLARVIDQSKRVAREANADNK